MSDMLIMLSCCVFYLINKNYKSSFINCLKLRRMRRITDNILLAKKVFKCVLLLHIFFQSSTNYTVNDWIKHFASDANAIE